MDADTIVRIAAVVGLVSLLFGIGILWLYGFRESRRWGRDEDYRPLPSAATLAGGLRDLSDQRAWDKAVALAQSADRKRRTEGPPATPDAFLIPEPDDPPEFELPAWVNNG